jgi:hypothetical protein
MSLRVKLLQNISQFWIIAPCEKKRLAWSGTRWISGDRDGLPLSELKALIFATARDAAAYAQDARFE